MASAALWRVYVLSEEFWELYAQDEEWGILTHGGVRIAHDGGISGVGKLLYGLQYFYAMVMVGFAIGNVYTISKVVILQFHLEGSLKHVLLKHCSKDSTKFANVTRISSKYSKKTCISNALCIHTFITHRQIME